MSATEPSPIPSEHSHAVVMPGEVTAPEEPAQEPVPQRRKSRGDSQTSYRILVFLSTVFAYAFFYWGWWHLFKEEEWEPVNTWLFAGGATLTFYLAADFVRRELGGERTWLPLIFGISLLIACVVAIFVFNIRFQQPAWDAPEPIKDIFAIQAEYPLSKNFRNAAGFVMINGVAGGALGALAGLSVATVLLWTKGR